MKIVKIGKIELDELKQVVTDSADQLKMAADNAKVQSEKIASLETKKEEINSRLETSLNKIAEMERKIEIEDLVQKAVDKGLITKEKQAEKIASLMELSLDTKKIAQIVLQMEGGDHGDGILMGDNTSNTKVASEKEAKKTPDSEFREKEVNIFQKHSKK